MLFGGPVSILHLANRAPNRQRNADTVTHAYSSNLISKLADQKFAWQLDMYPFQLFSYNHDNTMLRFWISN